MAKEKRKLSFSELAMLLVAGFTIILEFWGPEQGDKKTSIILFAIIIVYLGLLYALNYGVDKVKAYTDLIKQNQKDIKKMEEEMELGKKFNAIDKRLSILEVIKKKGKKGAIDPKIIFILILGILLYLYLRSKGLI